VFLGDQVRDIGTDPTLTRVSVQPGSNQDFACKMCIMTATIPFSRAKTFDKQFVIRILSVDGLYDPAFAGHFDESIVTPSTDNCPFRNLSASDRPAWAKHKPKEVRMVKKAKKAVKKTAKKGKKKK
jgi:hypothetical protein